MKYSTVNNLYFRNFRHNQNYILVTLVINKNKKFLERVFYDNCMICSWTFKSCANFVGDLLYCKGIDEKSAEIENINQLFYTASSYFVYPTYEEYLQFYESSKNSTNTYGKILNRIKITSDKKIDSDSYTIELEHLKDELFEQFNEKPYNHKSIGYDNQTKFCEVLDDIKDGNLSFIGFYQSVNAETLKEMITYRLIEKCFGFGKSDSIYNYYRSKGNSYAAISSYIAEANMFYTGMFSSFSNEIYSDLRNRIDEIRFKQAELDKAKKQFINDLLYSYFQYGEQMTTLQYTLHLEQDVPLKDIVDLAQHITTDDLSLAVSQKKHFIKVAI